MIVSDLARIGVALSMLLVWTVLVDCLLSTLILSVFGSFFEAAKNAAVPNITGDRVFVAGCSLFFSRFLLMALGAALESDAATVDIRRPSWSMPDPPVDCVCLLSVVSTRGRDQKFPLRLQRLTLRRTPSQLSD